MTSTSNALHTLINTLFRLVICIISSLAVSCSWDVNSNSEEKQYTLTINIVNGTVQLNPNKTKFKSGETVIVTVTANSGYDFDSWEGDETGSECPLRLVMDDDKTISAKMIPVPTTVIYYVDYSGGDDSNDGLSTTSAWKHAPGDDQATGVPAVTTLGPGCSVYFRGGVVYRGSITIPASGSLNYPVTYSGNRWPSGTKAIFDGGDAITGWTKCSSAAECGGNTNYNNIYYAYLSSTVDPLSINLHEYNTTTSTDDFLWMSQDPNPSDFYFYDTYTEFMEMTQSQFTLTSITDASYFTQSDLTDSYLLIWIYPNTVETRRILTYNTSTHTVTFDDLGDVAKYSDGRNQYYALFNSPHAIDTAGEYFISTTPDTNSKLKILLWPRSTSNLDSRITYSTRQWGINIDACNNIVVEGFSIIKYSGSSLRDGVGIGCITSTADKKSNIVIKDNYIAHNRKGGSSAGYGGVFLSKCSNVLVQNNTIEDNPRVAGIFFSGGSSITARGNTVKKSGATSIRFYTVDYGVVEGNTIRDSKGSHANGMTFYVACNNILIANNKVFTSNNPITFQDSGNLYFFNNLVDGGDTTNVVCEWINTSRGPWNYGTISFINNTFVRAKSNAAVQLNELNTRNRYYMINNIIDGEITGTNVKRFNNLYTGTSWYQIKSDYIWGDGEFVIEDINSIFTDASTTDFSLLSASPAINKGVDIMQNSDAGNIFPVDLFPDFDYKTDINGDARNTWDLGAYAY